MNLEALQKSSEQKRPLYRAYLSLIERFKAQRRLAKLDYRPNFNVWAGYRFREEVQGDPADGDDFVSAGVSLNIPIFREKRREAVAEADSGIRMAYQQYNDFRGKVHYEIQDSYTQLMKNRDLMQLYKTGIIPQASQALESTMSAYEVGKVDFLALLDSLMTLFNYELGYYKALSDHERSLARLEAAAGTILE